MTVADVLRDVLGPDVPVEIRAYDGSAFGPSDSSAAILIRSPDALRRIATAPNELGFGRAYVAGDIEIEGDLFAVLQMVDRFDGLKVRPAQVIAALQLVGVHGLRPLPPPPEEARLRGMRHSKARDAAAISYHYDLPSDFYRIVLGPSLTYSCAVWTDDTTSLEAAQANKHELVAQKLGLQPGMRLLDIGCGWGGMVLHAAHHHGVRAVGVTLSSRQAEAARIRVKEAELDDLVEIRFADYRDVTDGPYDAVSSIGMFEHVGLSQLAEYFACCHALTAPSGRFVNHGISRPAHMPKMSRARLAFPALRHEFIDRYVFPDGELHEIGTVVSSIQHAGFEVRHVESLREHYALTLRRWVTNLEAGWDDAVELVGVGRARVWRLYLAVATVLFEQDRNQIHQVLATHTTGGASGLPLRPTVALPEVRPWERNDPAGR